MANNHRVKGTKMTSRFGVSNAGNRMLAKEFGWGAASHHGHTSKRQIKVAERRCKTLGHDWKDESSGGPESGCMAAYCKRCGFEFHHQLY